MWCISDQSLTDYRGNVLNDGKLSRMAGAPRLIIVLCVALVMSLGGALGIVSATQNHLDSVARVPAATLALSPATAGVENYLLVGSDSRASVDPNESDYASIGSEEANPGMRSDTLILLRYDTKEKTVAMMSIPRDLWVRMSDNDKFGRVNAAYQRGPDVLLRTIERALNVPIHHYVEINFSGFKKIVDAIGGVRLCVPRGSRDKATGFYIGGKGCKLLTGSKALAYARSRHFEEKIDGVWRVEGTGDVGRGSRQRAFISVLAKEMVRFLARHPLDADNVLDSFTKAISVDENLDLIDLARKLRPVGDGSAVSYALPVSDGFSGDNFVFRLADDAPALLAYFAGLGPAPAAS